MPVTHKESGSLPAGTAKKCDFSIEVVPRTHNSYGTGSNPVGRTRKTSPLHMAYNRISSVQQILRGSYSGNTLAFQAKARSSILLPRSKTVDNYLLM